MSKNEIEDSQKAFWANHYKDYIPYMFLSGDYYLTDLLDLEGF